MSNAGQEMPLCSPPRLTRLIVPPNELRFENEVRGQAVTVPGESPMSLTSLTAKVAVEQKDQADELIKRRKVVSEMKKSFDRVQETIKSLKREISAVSRKISLAQDQIKKHTTFCKELEIDVENLISENQALTYKVSAKRKKFSSDRQLYDQCRVKMKNHIKLYEHYDSLSSTGQQIKTQEDIILHLQDELVNVAEGIAQEKLGVQNQISQFQSLTLDLREKTKLCQSEIAKEKDRQTLLKRDTELLQRRNADHLTRLKRQIQEAQARNRQWNEKACHLKKSIAEIRKKISEE